MDWKEGYAKSFGLQSQEIVKREIMEEGRKGETICKICQNIISVGERQIKIWTTLKDPLFYRVCSNCDNKIEELPKI